VGLGKPAHYVPQINLNMGLKQLRRHAAGIDVGAESIYIGLPDGRVHRFGTFTSEFLAAARLLKDQAVEDIAIESTGVYGVMLYEILHEQGFRVCLVNPSHAKSVPGRKTDVQDCQWLQQLHSYGLLNHSFIVDEPIKPLRDYLRLREQYIKDKARTVQHMQKALTLMNVRIHQVISQINGASGMRMLKAIIDGKRDPEQLLALCHERIQSTKREQVLAGLQGYYQPQHVYALADAVESYEFYEKKIRDCDRQIEHVLQELTQHKPMPKHLSKAKPIRHNKPHIDVLQHKMAQLTGQGTLTQLPGFTDYTVLRLVGELGTDLSKFATEQHFTSWLRLAPGKKNSGKTKRTYRYKNAPPAAVIFKQLAQSVMESKHIGLGAFGRKIRARRGPGVAIKALARKLAELYYRAMTKGMMYVEQGIQAYEQRYKDKRINYLIKQASSMGFELVPTET